MSTVYFDLGNVLIFFSFDQMFAQLEACTGRSSQELRKVLQQDEFLLAFETGSMTGQQLYESLQKTSPKTFSFEEMSWALSHIFTPNRELWPLVEQLRAKGHRLVLISNTNECHITYIRNHYPILTLFDRLILSYEVGACKPDPKIYKAALAEAKGKTFYTDDIAAYVEAGRKAGLDAELFIDVPTLEKCLKVRGFL